MPDTATPRGERTHSEIVQTAYRLFIQHGYHGTSMRQIARETHIALSGIYNHFASKEDLFIAVLTEFHPFFHVFPLLTAAQGDTVETFVRDAAKLMVKALGEQPSFLNLMFIELVEFKGKHLPLVFEILFPKTLELTQFFSRNQAKLRPIPPLILVRAYIGLFFSYVITELLIANQLPEEMRQGALDHFIDIFLYGVLAQPIPAKEAA